MSVRVTDWTKKVASLKLEDGDLIEFHRGNYSHWAVYIGNGQVAHLNPSIPDEKVGAGDILRLIPATVSTATLVKVAGASSMRVNNKPELYKKPRSFKQMKKILDEILVKQGFKYNLLSFNCEHFATGMKYGILESLQVRKIDALLEANIPALIATGLGRDDIFRMLQDSQRAIVKSKMFGVQKSKTGELVRAVNSS